MCTHISKLGPDYPGCFCIYCGDRVARIYAEHGQVVLDNRKAPRYVSVIHQNQQKAVKDINADAPRPRIEFSDGNFEEIDSSRLTMAFQDSEEVLIV